LAIAYFYTWTTYGTWLPGDSRGWFRTGEGFRDPDPRRQLAASLRMTESAIALDDCQRQVVEKTIVDHCQIRDWTLHAHCCRTNHVHVLLTATEYLIQIPREQLKAWCTRKLKAHQLVRREPGVERRDDCWTERGWDEYVDNEASLARVIEYINEQQ
jgi:REP element-mobilizing transposase RayT